MFYFHHYATARNDEKIIKLRAEYSFEGYAIYFMTLEVMNEMDNHHIPDKAIKSSAFSFGVTPDRLREILNYATEINLFQRDEDGYYSEKFIKQMEKSKKQRIANKENIDKYWAERHAREKREREQQ